MHDFPKDFLWGTASSPTQVEAGLRNDWTDYLHHIGAIAPDHNGRFSEDVEIMKSLDVNAYRFGVDWGRLQGGPRSPLSPDAVRMYRQMLQTLKDRSISRMVTLHHFANPLWLPRNGWKDPATVELFRDFVDRVSDALGDMVDIWNIVNEPEVYLLDKYIVGVFPPFKKYNVIAAYREARHLREAVIQCYPLLKGKGGQVISIAKNFRPFHTFSGTLSERWMAGLLNSTYNAWFFDRFFFHEGKPITDFIGINFYGPTRIKGLLPLVPGPFTREELKPLGVFDDIQEIDPPVLTEVLTFVRNRSTLPIMILENGVGSDDDELRKRTLIQTLGVLTECMKAGANVRGYFHWSLLDNIEWGFGNSVRFGLVGIDMHDGLRRIVKDSARVYAEVCRANGTKLFP